MPQLLPRQGEERNGGRESYFFSAFLSAGFFSAPAAAAGAAAPASVSAVSSLAAFLLFLVILSTRTLGKPKGLRPSFQRSSVCSTWMRSPRVSTLRERAS